MENKNLRKRRLLTFPEACDYLNVNESWLRRRVHRREVKFSRPGSSNKIYFDPAWLETLVNEGVVEPTREYQGGA